MFRFSVFLTLVLACGALPAAGTARDAHVPQATGDKPLNIALVPQDAAIEYCAQPALGDLDRPVGPGIRMKGAALAARVDAKGQLELDLRGDGKFRAVAAAGEEVVPVALKGDGGKTLNVKLRIFKRSDGAWAYRNLTRLLAKIENDIACVVDANGNGIYNEAGVDGVTFEGQAGLFPLPAPAERWCSPNFELAGLKLGPWGESPALSGRALSSAVAAALPVLKGVNEERVKAGLTPRPEDPKLSADLQKHCAYMAQHNQLTHPEEKTKPGYSPEGHAAGQRSILNMGSAPEHVAAGMVRTYFHRQDVLRPNTVAFGVGSDGRYSGIDGRSNCDKAPDNVWPVIYPVPGQKGLPTTYAKEGPDATPGDDAAGVPITAYFGTRKLKLLEHSLKEIGPADAAGKASGAAGVPARRDAAPANASLTGSVECYPYDPQTGASADFTGYQQCVCIIPKDPLKPGVEYEVTLKVDAGGKPWTKTWRFSTDAASAAPPRKGKR